MLTFAPDADPRTPGALNTMGNAVPTAQGYSALPQLLNSSNVPATTRTDVVHYPYFTLTPTSPLGKYFLAAQDTGSSADKLWVASSLTGAYSDISKAGGTYTRGNDWSFTAYGDLVIAANLDNVMQVSINGATFADLGGTPPKADIVIRAGDFVMAFNTVDATFGQGTRKDSWWASAIGNPASWSPSPATQAATGQLTEVSGAIKAAAFYNGAVYAFKDNAVWVGNYVGPPVMWSWQKLSGAPGCAYKRAVVAGGDSLFWAGSGTFWRYNGGSAPMDIGYGRVTQQAHSSLRNPTFQFNACHDPFTQRIFWFYGSVAANLFGYYCYDYRADKWSESNSLNSSCTLQTGLYANLDTLGNIYYYESANPATKVYRCNTIDTAPDVNNALLLKGGIHGDNKVRSLVTKLYLNTVNPPASVVLTSYMGPSLSSFFDGNAGPNQATSSGVTSANQTFDLTANSFWHQYQLAVTHAVGQICTVTDWDLDKTGVGKK